MYVFTVFDSIEYILKSPIDKYISKCTRKYITIVIYYIYRQSLNIEYITIVIYFLVHLEIYLSIGDFRI